MRLLFCCEFYFPSVGGVQEVMRQIAERLVRRGHDVTVATTRLAERDFDEHNGVKIVEFSVSGNLVRGIEGDVESYREFVRKFDCEAILIKAAQQWTFDAIWPDLDEIRARKVLIPCGFSGLFEPHYVGYFKQLPQILRKFDHLIFYAEIYRDVNFAREHNLHPFTVLPNGASEIEFEVEKDLNFRSQHGIPEDSILLLTVGSMTGVKGHKELLEAFSLLKTTQRHVTFIMNGNPPPRPQIVHSSELAAQIELTGEALPKLPQRMIGVYKSEGIAGLWTRVYRHGERLIVKCVKFSRNFFKVFMTEGAQGIRLRIMNRLGSRLSNSKLLPYMPRNIRALTDPLAFWMEECRRDKSKKLLIVSDYPRSELVQAYMAADLFVFASNVEYSPLVLFEAAAAGTPFLSVPVGNAEEIANWTGCGMICPAEKDERGYTRADPKVLAKEIAKAIDNPVNLGSLGQAGRLAWKKSYTWEAISTQYEAILSGTSMQNRSGK